MEKIIIEKTLSIKCEKPIYYFKDKVNGGFFCTCCDKEVFNMIDKKVFNEN